MAKTNLKVVEKSLTGREKKKIKNFFPFFIIFFGLAALVLCFLFAFVFNYLSWGRTEIDQDHQSFSYMSGLFMYFFKTIDTRHSQIVYSLSYFGWAVVALLVLAVILNIIYVIKSDLSTNTPQIVLVSMVTIMALISIVGIFLTQGLDWMNSNQPTQAIGK